MENRFYFFLQGMKELILFKAVSAEKTGTQKLPLTHYTK